MANLHHERVTTRKKWTLAAAALVAVIAVIVHAYRQIHSEPSYAGHTLTEWLEFEVDGRNGPDRPPLYAHPEAIPHMGTNAIPYLVRFIAESEDTPLKDRAALWLAKHLPKPLSPDNPTSWTSAQNRALRGNAAQFALQRLGPAAAPAIPELEKITSGPAQTSGVFAFYALSSIGPQAQPALERIAKGTNATPARVLALGWLRRWQSSHIN
jgi:hypothetical protein